MTTARDVSPVGNCAHLYNGKVCCLMLVQSDEIGPRPRARPRGQKAAQGIAQAATRTRASSKTFYADVRWLRRPGPWPGVEAGLRCSAPVT